MVGEVYKEIGMSLIKNQINKESKMLKVIAIEIAVALVSCAVIMTLHLEFWGVK